MGVAVGQESAGGQIRHLDKARNRFTRSGVGLVAVAGLKWDKSDDLRKRKSK
jgi:hypothetical protein